MPREDTNEEFDSKGKLLSSKKVTISDEQIAKEQALENLKKIPKAELTTSPLGLAILNILRLLDIRED